MPTTNTEQLYGYTLQQMAAESTLAGIDLTETVQIRQALLLGARRDGLHNSVPASGNGYKELPRMTAAQADEFLSRFSIVHQWSDSPAMENDGDILPRSTRPGDISHIELNDRQILANTGLSATLIRKRNADGSPSNEYTLAIRSTGFRPWRGGTDGEREQWAADIDSIVFTGFMLVQQEALECYYAWLKQNDRLPPGARLNAIGHALGAHLATGFTQLHRHDTDIRFGATVTFNGAGCGNWDASRGSLGDLLACYGRVLRDPITPPSRPLNTWEELVRFSAVICGGLPLDPRSIYSDPRHAWAVVATRIRFDLAFHPPGLFDATDGNDLVCDIDGRGLPGDAACSARLVDATVQLSDAQWQSADGRISYTRNGNDLTIAVRGHIGGMTIKNFKDGDFGIRLGKLTVVPRTDMPTDPDLP